MPRKTRMYLPGIPAHVIQRGNNRHACFFCEADYRYYLDRLAQGLRRFRVELHAYALMTNHVHMLMTPSDTHGISRLMQHLGRSYVLHVNNKYERTGTLWEGRHKASLVQGDRYLLACMRYIELNPVVAGIVKSPEHYHWSSHRLYACGDPNPLINIHDSYRVLAAEDGARRRSYRNFCLEQGSDSDEQLIRESLAFNYPIGNDRFREQIEQALGRQVGRPRRGRPPTSSASPAPK